MTVSDWLAAGGPSHPRRHGLSLEAHARLEAGGEGVRLVQGDQAMSLARPSSGLRERLERLADPSRPPATLDDLRRDADPLDRLSLDLVLARLDRIGALNHSVLHGSRELLRVWRMGSPGLLPPGCPADGLLALSRFCHVRAETGRTLLASAAQDFEAWLLEPLLAAALARLCRPAGLAELETEGLRGEPLAECLSLLARVGTLEAVRAASADDDGEADLDGGDDPLATWEFHDLLFHRRSRSGFHDHPSGGTFRFGGRVRCPPLCNGPGEVEPIPLGRPAGPPPSGSLFDVLARRRSIRDPAAEPIGVDGLSALLFYSARLTSIHDTPVGEVATRPYPSGGGLHELDLYLAVSRCASLPRGCYRYQPDRHALAPLTGSLDALDRLLDDAAFSTMLGRRPDVLLIAAGRFRRLSVKYEGIAYALMLKHVGCLIQTVYLVATALDLGCCAVGDGNARWFAQATRTDPFAVAPVGEMILGGPPGPPA